MQDSMQVRDIIKNPSVIQTIGNNKYIIRGKFKFIKFINGNVEIDEKLYPLISRSYMTCNFVFTGVPNNIKSINMLLQNKVLETVVNHNGIVRFRTFAYSVSENPLLSICFEKNKCVKFTYKLSRSTKKLPDSTKTAFLFDSLSLPKSLYDSINAHKYISKLPCCSHIITYEKGKGSVL